MKREIVILGIAAAISMGACFEPSAAARQAAEKPKEVAVDTKILARYVGRYQLTPGSVLTIRLNGDHLYAIAQGQQLAEMYPSSQKDFFLDAADTTFTFVTDNEGRATEVVLHVGGRDQRAARVEATESH